MRRCRYKKSKILLGFILVSFLLLTCIFPSFASPSLDDSVLTYSVKAYYLKYTYPGNWSYNTIISSDGTITSTSSYRLTSGYISVTPGGTVAIVPTDRTAFLLIYSCCFFDSDYNVVSGGFDYSSDSPVYSVSVPIGATYIRLTQYHTSNIQVVSSPSSISSLSNPYIWGTIDNISISDGVIDVPLQIYGYTEVYFDFEFYSNSVLKIDSFSLDVYSWLTGTFIDGVRPNDYSDGTYLTLYSYYYQSGSRVYDFLDDSVNNPASFIESFSPKRFFSGFRMYVPINQDGGSSIDSSLHVELSNFMLNSYSAIAIDDIKTIQQQLSDYSLEQIGTVNLTEFDTLLGDYSSRLDEIRAQSVFSSIYSSAFIVTLMGISLVIGFLGYILYGKSV